MPKISDDKRAARRAQILEAAWTCFQREGIHATTMDDIIRASGLSAGAVYSYYPSKDELILAAVATSLDGVSALLQPILTADPLPEPGEMTRRIMVALTDFTRRDGYDLKRIALLGWAEAQRNERLRTLMRGSYLGFRNGLEAAARRWAAGGTVDVNAPPEAIAKALLSLVLGFVVQSAIIGPVDADDVAAGIDSLSQSS